MGRVRRQRGKASERDGARSRPERKGPESSDPQLTGWSSFPGTAWREQLGGVLTIKHIKSVGHYLTSHVGTQCGIVVEIQTVVSVARCGTDRPTQVFLPFPLYQFSYFRLQVMENLTLMRLNNKKIYFPRPYHHFFFPLGRADFPQYITWRCPSFPSPCRC